MRRIWATVLLAVALTGAMATSPVIAAGYDLGSGDQVRVKVYEWRSAVGDVHEWAALNADFSVGADGALSLPLLGTLPAAGRTLQEVADAIGSRLQQTLGLTAPPQASVEVVKYRPFYILGSLNKPGEYPFRPGMTVLQAVSIAGGLFRVNDPGLLLAQRTTLTAVGDLRVLQLEFNGLLARRARLKAEIDGTEKISFPQELLQQQGNPAIAQLIDQEQVMFTSRRDALNSETDALNRLKQLLNGEVASMQAKVKNLDQELTLLKSELANTSALVQRGLAAAPREFTLRQTELQTEGRRLDLDTATLRAREDIGKADQAVIELQNKIRNATLTELAQVESKLSETTARIRTGKAIIAQESAGPDLLSVLGQESGPATYSIVRRTGNAAETLAATEASSVQPGDTIEVKRAGAGLSSPVAADGPEPLASEAAANQEPQPPPRLTKPRR